MWLQVEEADSDECYFQQKEIRITEVLEKL